MKEIFDYMFEHSGGNSIDFNSMISDINRLEAENARFRDALEDELLTDEFVYVVDDEGIQLVVDMEWPQEKKKKKPKSKKDFDFTKYDA